MSAQVAFLVLATIWDRVLDINSNLLCMASCSHGRHAASQRQAAGIVELGKYLNCTSEVKCACSRMKAALAFSLI